METLIESSLANSNEGLREGELETSKEGLLHRIANRIRQSLELQEILDTTATEVRDYLKIDRVKIYRFNSDHSGVVIAESIAHQRLPSLMGLHFPADDIPPYARELFLKARQRSVVDVMRGEIGLSPFDETEGTANLADSDLRYRPLDPCHAAYLTAMGVQSSVVVPIVLAKESSPASAEPALLWGLLACHHSAPRRIAEAELQFIQAVVDQVGVAIAQSILLHQVRSQATQEANINHITQLLYAQPTIDFAEALAAAVTTFQGSGGRLYLLPNEHQRREIFTCGAQPACIDSAQQVVEENHLWKNFLHSAVETSLDSNGYRPWSLPWMRAIYNLKASAETSSETAVETGGPWAIDNLYGEPLLRTLAPFFEATSACSLLIIPLHHGTRVVGCLTIFRSASDTEILWAGYHNPDTRQLMARQSFEVWKQEKKNQALPWREADLKYAQSLSARFSAAVEQYRLYQQIQSFNASLENQVAERTAQLQLSNQELEGSILQQKVLANIVAKIRESLNIEEIFSITTQELCHLLEAEKAAVYRFSEDWSGTFVAASESVTARWVESGSLGVNTIWQDTHLQETQGGRYRDGKNLVVEDVYSCGFSPCHVDLYEQFHIRAFVTVPVFVGSDLWGILAVYQYQEPRHWDAADVEFVSQISAQLGVALQHAALLARNRRKKQILSDTLKSLKETQTQLIQTEKMSSLGQLVAGVAHEINNPVNFIHANLAHLQKYASQLLSAIATYQQHYPTPAAEIEALLEEIDIAYIEQDLPQLCASLTAGTKRIRTIVSSLRSFSRLDESDLKTVDIHEGIESTLSIVQHRLEANETQSAIELIKDYGELPPIECYPGRLNQVFMNLLTNAIDELQDPSLSADTARTITIKTQPSSEGWVIISVTDNGNGIPAANLAKLFDPFFTTKPVGKGTGLGLSISYNIIKEHGGRLHCTSDLGAGSEFVIELPIKPALPAPEQ
jgi:light-regulated signal transduction histidine kinase (bacteriophytochrome)